MFKAASIALAIPTAIIAHALFAGSKYPNELAALRKTFQAYTKKPYRAVVYGGTGAVGNALIAELLASPACVEVIAIGRRSVLDNLSPTSIPKSADGVPSEQIDTKKLKQILLPNFEKEIFEKQEQLQNETRGADVAFVCIATTRRHSGGDPERFVQLEKKLPVQTAKISKGAGIPNASIITAIGSDINSSVLAIKTKGEVEKEFADLKFNRLSIVRPMVLVTKRWDAPWYERLAIFLSPTLDLFLKGTNYESSLVHKVARGMRKDFEQSLEKQQQADKKPEVGFLDCADYHRIVNEDFEKAKKI